MSSRGWQSAAAGLALLALSACSGGVDPGQSTPSTSAGTIEIAVSATCQPGSEPNCTQINDQHVVLDAAEFVAAGVTDAAPGSPQQDQEMLEVTLDDDGASAFRAATAEVAEAGNNARLVLQVGENVLSAVQVPEPVEGAQIQIALPAAVNAEELAEQLAPN